MAEDWPKVWLIFATYKRTETALFTIRSLRDYLVYPNLHWHVADDGSGSTDDGTDRWHVGVLVDEIAKFYPEVTWHEMGTPAGQFNTGGNINTAIRAMKANGCHTYHLNFDDWALFRELDIRPAVDVLQHHEEVGFVRLSYKVEWLYGCTQAYYCPTLNKPMMWWRLLRPKNAPKGWKTDSYVVSTQPYVAHTRFHDAYGWHPEHCNPGEAETHLGYQYNDSPLGEDGPQILFHIGEHCVHAPWRHMVGRAHYYAALG